jgi:hypothetical protein
MADEILSALQGMQQSPSETYWGIGQQALGQSLPQLIDPVYGNRGTNIGIALGGALIQGLLGYQARQEAAERNLQASQLANALIQLETPEARTSFIGEAPTEFQGGLGTLATALTAQKIQREAKVAEAIGLETGKLKALQEFYNTPAGIAQREFELNKIKEEAAARRTPLEDYLAREAARKERELAVEGKRQEGRFDLQTLRDANADNRKKMELDARYGDAEKQRTWKSEQTKIEAQYNKELAQYKAELGVDAAVQKEQLLNDIRLENINNGESAELALVNARAAVTKQVQTDLLKLRDEISRNRMREYNEGIIERTKLRKQLDAEYPAITAKIKDDAANANAFANLAKDLANDIRQISSYPEYRAIKSMSALGDKQLKSRTIDIADRLTRLRSGMATRGAEDAKLEKIALGDLTVGPQEAAAILERLANDTLLYAADKMATQMQKPSDLVNSMRAAAKSNSKITLQPRLYEGTETAGITPVDSFVNNLKSKYGSDWKTKMNADERAAAMALVEATRQ